MRLNALCLIGALTILMMPLSARAIPAQAERQTAHAQQAATAAYTCLPGYYWEPDGYVSSGKFRPAHCARRW
jgi:hypothetical protein